MECCDAAKFSAFSPINCSTGRIITHFFAFPAALSTRVLLLQAQGIQADSEEHTAFDPEFLMQQMEWREELAAARAANSVERLTALDNQVAAEEARLLTKLSTAFRQADYTQAAELVPQGRFLDKIRQEIHAAL